MSMTQKVSKGSLVPDPLFTFRPHCGEVTSLKYVKVSEKESGVASGTSSGWIHLWSLNSKRPLWHENLDSPVIALDTCCIQGEMKLLSQTRNNDISVWDYNIPKRTSAFKISDPGFCKFTTFSNKFARYIMFEQGECLSQMSSKVQGELPVLLHQVRNSTVNVYDVSSGKVEESYETTDSKPRGMCMCVKSLSDVSSGVSYLLGGFEDGTVVLWDLRVPRTELHSCELFTEPVLCMTVDETGRGAAGSVGTAVHCFSVLLNKGVVEKNLEIEVKNPGVSDIAVRYDQKVFATGGWDGRIRVFTWMKGNPLAIINYHSHSINTVDFTCNTSLHSDKNILLCGAKDEVISVWKLF